MNYDIFVITRFNIAVHFSEGGENIKKGCDTCVDVEYLSERFRLFEKYTLPTMKRQTFTDFKWLVLFSDRTPEMFRKKIAAYKKEFSHFEPIYISADEAKLFNETLAEILKDRMTKELLFSIRLDNDDAVGRHFVEDMVDCAEQNSIEDEAVLYYKIGVQYNERKNIATRYDYPGNHFTALVYPIRGGGTGRSFHTITEISKSA